MCERYKHIILLVIFCRFMAMEFHLGAVNHLCCPIYSSDTPGQSVCTSCPAGFYCPSNSSSHLAFPCPEGYYCPNGTEHAFQYPCPPGTYNPAQMGEAEDDCLWCPPGQYCESKDTMPRCRRIISKIFINDKWLNICNNLSVNLLGRKQKYR